MCHDILYAGVCSPIDLTSTIQSGYRAEFLPLLNPTHQPLAPDQLASDVIVNCEPVFMSLTAWKPRKRSNGDLEDHGGEYMTMWYAGQIAEDAVRCMSSQKSSLIEMELLIFVFPDRSMNQELGCRMKRTMKAISFHSMKPSRKSMATNNLC